MGTGEPPVHRVELLPHVTGQVGRRRRREYERHPSRVGGVDGPFRVGAVLVEERLAADRLAVRTVHAAADAVPAERPHHEVDLVGVEVVLKWLEEVARRGAAEGAGLDLEPERGGYGLEVGLGLCHERVAVDGHVGFLRRCRREDRRRSCGCGSRSRSRSAAARLRGRASSCDDAAEEDDQSDDGDHRDHAAPAYPTVLHPKFLAGHRQNREISLPIM